MKANVKTLKIVVAVCCLLLIAIVAVICLKPSKTAKNSSDNKKENTSKIVEEKSGEVPAEPEETPVPVSLTIDDVKQLLSSQYGISSQSQFVSCLGTDLQPYPSNIYGLLSVITIDLNNDGTEEFIALRVASPETNGDPQIVVELYHNVNGQPSLITATPIDTIAFCEASNIYLYYSTPLNSYCLIVDSYSGGSYTGIDSALASIYTVTINSINLYKNLESVPGIQYVDITTEFNSISAPYAKYCTQIDNTNATTYYQPLCEVEHELFGDLDFYETRNHKLLIKSTVSN